jgi:DNA topoisomerase-3
MGARVCACAREADCRHGPGTGPHQRKTHGKDVIIAEKPSVAQDIVRALTPTKGKFEKGTCADHFENDDYVVTSAVGHLVEIKAPEEYDVKRGKWSFANLPVVPPHFDLAPHRQGQDAADAVVKQVKRKDVSAIINACDAGREGELIFRLIVQYAYRRQAHPSPSSACGCRA